MLLIKRHTLSKSIQENITTYAISAEMDGPILRKDTSDKAHTILIYDQSLLILTQRKEIAKARIQYQKLIGSRWIQSDEVYNHRHIVCQQEEVGLIYLSVYVPL